MEAVEKRSSDFFVMTMVGQHGVAGHQEAVSHRDVGPLLTAARSDPPKLSREGREAAFLGVRGSPGRFARGAPEPLVAFARAATAALSSALIVLWTQPWPNWPDGLRWGAAPCRLLSRRRSGATHHAIPGN